jgi:ketosteroid isomerase-like protein
MRSLALAVVVSGLTAIAHAQTPAPAPAPPASPSLSAGECAVWAREASFAQSVADHDATAFAEHLHADAVFIDGRGGVTRGRDAVAADWAGLIAGKDVALHWYPDAVSIAGDTGIALSRGPYWIENLAPDAKQRYVAGRFISTWVRDPAGQWHVLYDGGGGGNAKPATDAEIAALKAARKACPRADPRG